MIRGLIALLLALVLTPAAGEARQDLCEGRPLLFIGNSFTFENDLPGMTAALLTSAGSPTANPSMIAIGGAHLADHLAEPAAPRLVQQGGWCAVILQDYSTAALVPAFQTASRHAIRSFARMARDAGTPVVLLATWPRRAGHPLYDAGWAADPADMAEQVDAFLRGEAAGFPHHTVAPAGRLWLRALGDGHRLHARDGYHAQPAGTYLAALAILKALGADPARADWAPRSLDDDTAAALRRLAAAAPGW